ncbi:MAG: Neocarzinostatin family [Actinomycetota bacterium]|jgi:hypothetical protein|nr:Neocarzinostatin family [Actinomycetota bacterium]
MILLVVLALVVVAAAAAAGLLGIGVLSGDNRQGRPAGGRAALAVPVVAGIGVVVVVVLALGLVGGRMASREGQPSPAPSPAGPTTTTTTTATTPRPAGAAVPRATLQPVAGSMPVVSIRAADDRFGAYPLVSGLRSGSVVEVRADGFAEFERGRVEQCVVELARQTACAPAFPVQFDIDGRADFQLAVQAEIAPGGCRVGQATCLLRLTGDESGRHGMAQMVVGEEVAPGRVTVAPDRGVVDGQEVEVSVRGFPPGTSATAVLCAPPEPYDVGRCADAGPASTFTVDGEGSGRTTLVVSAGRLCGPGRRCGVTVVVGAGFVAAPAAPITFSTGPGVAYDRDRVIPGVAIALVLVAAAIVIARRTDWAKPTEADTPQLDDADLRSDRSLDDLFGTDEDLDERDPIPW